MNFFRSEDHLHKWEGYQVKKAGGTIALDSLMQLFSRPYFTNRSGPDWVSRMSEYLADMMSTLDKLQNAGDHWRMSPLEKFGFTVAMKLGLL